MMRPERQTEDVVAGIRRQLRALERRASAGDDTAAVELVKLAGEVRNLANVGLAAAHRYGYSYQDLALWVGVSRQAIAERVQRQEAAER